MDYGLSHQWRKTGSSQTRARSRHQHGSIIADTYDTEVRNTIDRLLSIFTPVVTLLLAVLIGTIVLSVLVAILSVNDLVG